MMIIIRGKHFKYYLNDNNSRYDNKINKKKT